MKYLFCLALLMCTSVQAATVQDELEILTRAKDYIYQQNMQSANPNWELFSDLARNIGHRQEFLNLVRDDKYILVNKSDYHLRVIDNKKEVLYEKVIVGRASRPTPEFNEALTHIVVNPYWNVPSSLQRKDVIPAIRKRPTEQRLAYIQHMGYRFFVGKKEIKPENINWQEVPSGMHIRQDPGVLNALGQIKFLFPNPYSVYIHDTPHRELFQHTKRNYSSGCIRLQNPEKLAAVLLKEKPSKINNMINNPQYRDHWIKMDTPIRVYIVNWDTWATSSGEIKYSK